MKTAFLELSARIAEKVPEIQWTDLDYGQFEMPGHLSVAAFPAALAGISYPEAENITDTAQMVDISIVVRLGFSAPGAVADPAGQAEAQAVSVSKLEIVNKLHTALQGWGTDTLAPLSRASMEAERRADGLSVYRLEYRSSGEEDTQEAGA